MKYNLLFLLFILLLLSSYYPLKRTGIIGEAKAQTYRDYTLISRLSTTLLTVMTTNKTSFISFVNNTGTATVKSVKISIEGVPLDWLNILPLESDILPAETKEYLITISIPNDAEPGIYNLSVKAKDGVESETRNLTMIVGKNQKEIADILLTELNEIKTLAEKSLLISDCIKIVLIQASFDDAEVTYKNGMKEYDNENYSNSMNWFEYALPVYGQVVERVDVSVMSEISTVQKLKLLTPIGLSFKNQLNLAENYLNEKEYEKICDPIIKIRNLIMMGIVFWSAIIIIAIISIIAFFIIRRKRREIEREQIIERVRERLGSSDEGQT